MLEHLAYPYSALVVVVVALLFWRPVWGIALLHRDLPDGRVGASHARARPQHRDDHDRRRASR